MDELRTRIADAIRREREAAGITPAELARRAGVSKATVSQLEAGATNPTVETLWAIGGALGIPFSAFVEPRASAPKLIRAGDYAGVPSAAAPYVATLVAASPPGARRDLYVITAEPGESHQAEPHPSGTVEHVIMISGSALVGPASAPVELHPGDYLTYPADELHIFQAHSPHTSAVLLTELR